MLGSPEENVPVRTVVVPGCEAHEGYYAIKVDLKWRCPKCRGPRGETRNVFSFDGSRRLVVDGWDNPCGHIDYYPEVRAEALEYAREKREFLNRVIASLERVVPQRSTSCRSPEASSPPTT